MKPRMYLISVVITLLLAASFQFVFADDPIRIFINDTPLEMDVSPIIVEDRTLVPFRAIFEAIDAEIGWNEVTRTAIGTRSGTRIELPIGRSYGIVNGSHIPLDAPAMIVKDRTLVPLRFVTENMGFEVVWDGDTRTIYLSNQETEAQPSDFEFYGLSIGSSENALRNQLGTPDRVDASIYGFNWYIYNNDYANYIQFGVQNQKIVALYTNNAFWRSKNGLQVGSSKNDLVSQYGYEMKELIKANTRYVSSSIDPNDEYGLYLIDGVYARFFYDLHNNSTITSVFLVQKDTEEAFTRYHGTPSEALKTSLEQQAFDLANAVRARMDLAPFEWSEKAANTARQHSADMADNNFFAHANLEGEEPHERGMENGITYSIYAENIAGGLPNAIYTHEAWMNSKGHREKILYDIERLGVGVAFGGFYSVYYTENFYTPR